MRFAATALLIATFAFAGIVMTGQHHQVARLANVVGVGAYVPPNAINTAAQQIATREAELEAWERDLTTREAEQAAASRELMDVLAVSVGAIAALLGLNFYLDSRRRKQTM
jgi:hypothetical protein